MGKSYAPEFRRRVVQRVRDGRAVNVVAAGFRTRRCTQSPGSASPVRTCTACEQRFGTVLECAHMPTEVLIVTEAASKLRMHPATIRRLVQRGHLAAIQIGGKGGKLRIEASALVARKTEGGESRPRESVLRRRPPLATKFFPATHCR